MKTLLKILIIATISLTAYCAYSYAAEATVPDEYALIQDAIGAVYTQGGGTVLVKDGTYDQGDIAMQPGVNLAGQEYGTGEAIIIGTITTADNVELRGLRVENIRPEDPETGIVVSSNNVSIKNVVVHVGNDNDYDRGIYLNGANGVTIENSTVHINAYLTATMSEDTACIYSENSTYTLRNNILTLNDASLNAISSGSDSIEIAYNCILGRLSPLTLAHKGTLFASPGYVDAINGDFLLVEMPPVEVEPGTGIYEQGKSPSIALDSGEPASPFNGEIQIVATNKAIDLGAYGNTEDTVMTTIAGDFNVDGYVNLCDLIILAGNWQGVEKTYFEGDANFDSLTNLCDLIILAGNWQGVVQY